MLPSSGKLSTPLELEYRGQPRLYRGRWCVVAYLLMWSWDVEGAILLELESKLNSTQEVPFE